MILGVGTDIVQIDRIESIFKKYGEAFLQKNFHPEELKQFAELNEKHKLPYLAKRFAGKEAFAKALGSGIRDGLNFKDIAILNNELGAPYVKIFADIALDLSDKKINISLSDDYPVAIAFVVIQFDLNKNSNFLL